MDPKETPQHKGLHKCLEGTREAKQFEKLKWIPNDFGLLSFRTPGPLIQRPIKMFINVIALARPSPTLAASLHLFNHVNYAIESAFLELPRDPTP